MTASAPHPLADHVRQTMVRWLERAVIGLNLCPFAKAVHTKGQIHYVVSDAQGWADLLATLDEELKDLAALTSIERDTTLLIAPEMLHDFAEFNDFLAQADRLLVKRGWEGQFQIASFHPDYQFDGTDPDDVTNCTNRAPYPTLHLLRETSLDRAVVAFPEAEAIFEKNMQTLQALGHDGWAALGVAATAPSPPRLPTSCGRHPPC